MPTGTLAGTSGHDHRLGHSNLQESQLAKVDSDAKEGTGRNDDHSRRKRTGRSQRHIATYPRAGPIIPVSAVRDRTMLRHFNSRLFFVTFLTVSLPGNGTLPGDDRGLGINGTENTFKWKAF